MNLNLIGVVLLTLAVEITAIPKRIPCPTIKLKNGKVRYRQKNRFVKFTCNAGFLLAGERYSTCDNGQWDGLIPKCVRSSCVKVSPPANALIYPSHRGGVLNFFCKPGFALRGFNVTYCDGMHWDNKLPSCIESNTLPKLQCDFESEDLCGWNHDLRHDFDWRRKNFTTPTGHLGTGPSNDHTKGANETNYYMYIESSLRNENDTARLISPIYDKMNNSDVCFEFYFQMYGSTTGQLRAYLKKESDDWKLDPSKAFFWKLGNHGEHWIRSRNLLGPIDEDFQIVMEGVRGSGHFSGIAIDDVSIITNCTLEDISTERDFEYTWEEDDLQSCVNRCDTYNSSFSCDCDDTCIDNNTCCLDYIAVCLLGTEEYSSTIVTQEPVISTMYESELTSQDDTTILTTLKIVPSTTKPTTQTTTTKPTTLRTTTKLNTMRTTTTPKTLQVTTKPTTTTLRITTKPTTLKTNTKTTKKKTTTKTTSTSTPTAATKRKKPVITTIKTTTKKIILDTTSPPQLSSKSIRQPIDEILTVPTLRGDLDENFNFTQIIPLVTSTINRSPLNTDLEKTFVNNHVIIITAAALVLVLIIVVIVVIIIRRHRLVGCRLHKMKHSTSDSQSDVRFLTSDEILNFNLAYCDD